METPKPVNRISNLLTTAWEVILGPSFSSITRLGVQEAVAIIDKTLLKHIIDTRSSLKVALESSDGKTLPVYLLTFENKNQLFFMVRDDMIKYKMRSVMNELDSK